MKQQHTLLLCFVAAYVTGCTGNFEFNIKFLFNGDPITAKGSDFKIDIEKQEGNIDELIDTCPDICKYSLETGGADFHARLSASSISETPFLVDWANGCTPVDPNSPVDSDVKYTPRLSENDLVFEVASDANTEETIECEVKFVYRLTANVHRNPQTDVLPNQSVEISVVLNGGGATENDSVVFKQGIQEIVPVRVVSAERRHTVSVSGDRTFTVSFEATNGVDTVTGDIEVIVDADAFGMNVDSTPMPVSVGGSVQIVVEPYGGTPPYSATFDPHPVTVGGTYDPNTLTAKFDADTNIVFGVTVNDSSSPQRVENIEIPIIVGVEAEIEIFPENSASVGTEFTIQATPKGGSGYYDIEFTNQSNGDVLNGFESNGTWEAKYTPSSAGIAVIQVTAIDTQDPANRKSYDVNLEATAETLSLTLIDDNTGNTIQDNSTFGPVAQGSTLNVKITANGGVAGYTIEATGSTQGPIADTPLSEREWIIHPVANTDNETISITITDSTSGTAEQSFEISIVPSLAVPLTPQTSTTDVAPLESVTIEFTTADGAEPTTQCYLWESYYPGNTIDPTYVGTDSPILVLPVTEAARDVRLVVLDEATCSNVLGISSTIPVTMASLHPTWGLKFTQGANGDDYSTIDLSKSNNLPVIVKERPDATSSWEVLSLDDPLLTNAQWATVLPSDPSVTLWSDSPTSGSAYLGLNKNAHFGTLPPPGTYYYWLQFRAQRDGAWAFQSYSVKITIY